MAGAQGQQISATPTVAAGSRVVLVVSSGPPEAQPTSFAVAPSVVGEEQGKALSDLQAEGLQASVFNDYSDSVARGKVIAQLPAPGMSAPVGAKSVLIVSAGKPAQPAASVALPDVVGLPEAEASAKLQQNGLSPQVIRESSPTVPVGVVIAQLPNRESLAATPAKSTWWIWLLVALAVIALGVAAYFLFFAGPRVEVPRVINLTQANAAQRLEEAGLVVGSITETESADVQKGIVVGQDPESGAMVREGSAVNLVVVGGAPLVEVPDVVKKSQAEATSQLEAAGLKAEVTTAPSNTVDKGFVVSQTPAAGQQVPTGTTVGVVVSEGQRVENVKVPNVVGLTQADAERAIQDAELTASIGQAPSTDVAVGVVISQVPEEGQSVAPGTTVGIVVSTGPPPASSDNVEVPNLVGETLTDAQKALTDAGLQAQPLALAGTSKPQNEVVGQSPAAGTQMAKGSTVVVFYSSGQ